MIDPYPSATSIDGRQGQGRRRQGRRLPAAGRDAVRDLRLVHGVEPLDPVARARHQPAVRVADRPRDHVRVREEVRLRQGVRQELQDGQAGREQVGGAGTRVDPARDQQGHLDHRLHRPVAGAAEAAHEAHADVRREDAARQGRPLRRRLLRPAVAVLRHARAQAPGLAEPVRHLGADDGRRRLLPRQLRRRARRGVAAGRGRLVSRRAASSPPATPNSTTCC